MKIALCISGQPRFVRECQTLFEKNITDFNKFDVFIHTWSDSKTTNACTQVESIEKITQYYKNIKGMSIEAWEPLLPLICTHDGEEQVVVHHSMFYTMFRSNQLKKEYEKANKFKYDYVVWTRFDTALLEEVNIRKHSKTKINVPYNRPNGTPCDWLLFSSSEVMDKALSAWRWMNKNDSKQKAGEEIFRDHWQRENLESNKFSSKEGVMLVRRTGHAGPDTWIELSEVRKKIKTLEKK